MNQSRHSMNHEPTFAQLAADTVRVLWMRLRRASSCRPWRGRHGAVVGIGLEGFAHSCQARGRARRPALGQGR